MFSSQRLLAVLLIPCLLAESVLGVVPFSPQRPALRPAPLFFEQALTAHPLFERLPRLASVQHLKKFLVTSLDSLMSTPAKGRRVPARKLINEHGSITLHTSGSKPSVETPERRAPDLNSQEFWMEQVYLLGVDDYASRQEGTSLLLSEAGALRMAQIPEAKAFFINTLFPYLNRLAHGDEGNERKPLAQFLGPLAVAVMALDPTGRLLKEQWVPVYKQLIFGSNSWIASEVYPALGPLAQALVKTDPSGRLLQEHWVELFDLSMEHGSASDGPGKSLEGLARAAMEASDPHRFMTEIVLPRFKQCVNPSRSTPMRQGGYHSLGTLAEMILRVDPAGNLFKSRWIPLYKAGLLERYNSMPHDVGFSLSGIGQALLHDDTLREKLWPSLLRRYHGILTNEKYGYFQNGTYQSLGTLARVLLKQDPSGKLFKKEWIPLFQRGLKESSRDSQKSTADTLGEVAEALDNANPSLMKTLWEPLFEEAYTAMEWNNSSRASYSLIGLAPALATQKNPDSLRLQSWLPLIEKTLLSSGSPEEVAKSLGPLGLALLKRDPSGHLLRTYWIPLLEKIRENNDLERATNSSIGDVGRAMMMSGTMDDLVIELWHPLNREAILYAAFSGVGSHGSPEAFNNFDQTHHISEIPFEQRRMRRAADAFVHGWQDRGTAESIGSVIPLIPALLPYLEASDLTAGKFSEEMTTLLMLVKKIGKEGTVEEIQKVGNILIQASQNAPSTPEGEELRESILYLIGRLCEQSPDGKAFFNQFLNNFIFARKRFDWMIKPLGMLSRQLTSEPRLSVLEKRMPSLMEIFADPQRTARFLFVLGLLRHLYPYDTTLKSELPPIAYARQHGIEFKIGEFTVVPLCDSFRRHVLYVGDPDRDGYAIELKIPGEKRDKRIVDWQHFTFAEQIATARPQDPKTVRPVFFWRPRGTFTLYGKPYNDDMVGIVAFEYKDGKRNSFITPGYLEYVSQRTGKSVETLQRDNQRETIVWGMTLHEMGVAVSDEVTSEHGQVIVHTDAHNENVKLNVDGTTESIADFGIVVRDLSQQRLERRQQEIRELLFGPEAKSTLRIEPDLLSDVIKDFVRFEPSLAKRAAMALRAIEETGYDKDHTVLMDHLRTMSARTEPTLNTFTDLESQLLSIVQDGGPLEGTQPEIITNEEPVEIGEAAMDIEAPLRAIADGLFSPFKAPTKKKLPHRRQIASAA